MNVGSTTPDEDTIYSLLAQQLKSAQVLIELNQAITSNLEKRGQSSKSPLSFKFGDGTPSERTESREPSAHAMDKEALEKSLRHPLLPVKSFHATLRSSCRSETGFSSYASHGSSVGGGGTPPNRRKRKRPVFAAAASKKPEGAMAEYNVEDLYSDEGCAQFIARNGTFQTLTLLVILFNTIWMGIDTDYNHAPVLCQAPLIFQIMDNFFCVYFCFELSVRFLAFGRKADVFRDAWFVFDTLLVLLMVWETWAQTALYLIYGNSSIAGGARSATVLRLFRAFRLLRISRMTRLLRMMPELFILIKSLGTAMRCMGMTLCMLLLVIYVFAIMFTQLLSGTPTGKGHFDSVPEAMNFMLTSVLCGFDADFINLLLADSLIYYMLWLCYVLIGSLSIMNVLIGILCEVVSGTADAEKERVVKTDIVTHVCKLGFDPEVVISKHDMTMALEDPNISEELEAIGIDVYALLDFVHYFEENTQMYVDDFADVIIGFRGCKPTTVNDMVNLRKFITMEVDVLGRAMNAKTRK